MRLAAFAWCCLLQRIPSKTKRIYCAYERLMVSFNVCWMRLIHFPEPSTAVMLPCWFCAPLRIPRATTGPTDWLWPNSALLTSPSCLCCSKVTDTCRFRRQRCCCCLNSFTNYLRDSLCADMTFINEGNPNYVDKLVNFEKLVRLKRCVPQNNYFLKKKKKIRCSARDGLKCFLFLPPSQRMIARTVKIVRGCRSQPYSKWAGLACHASRVQSGRALMWNEWRNSTHWNVGHIMEASVLLLQSLRRHRGAWQTGCFWKGLLCACQHVSYICLNSLIQLLEKSLFKLVLSRKTRRGEFVSTKTWNRLCIVLIQAQTTASCSGIPATSGTTSRTWRWSTTSANSRSSQGRSNARTSACTHANTVKTVARMGNHGSDCSCMNKTSALEEEIRSLSLDIHGEAQHRYGTLSTQKASQSRCRDMYSWTNFFCPWSHKKKKKSHFVYCCLWTPVVPRSGRKNTHCTYLAPIIPLGQFLCTCTFTLKLIYCIRSLFWQWTDTYDFL